MTKKITLSIPDSLHNRLDQWRRAFNLSKMFQDALTEAIRKKEEFRKRVKTDGSLPDIIERLRLEKIEFEKRFFSKGLREGLRWARAAHYEELVYAVNWSANWKIALKPTQDAVLGEYLCKKIRAILPKSICSQDLAAEARAFIKGWQKGVIQFWEEIKDKLET